MLGRSLNSWILTVFLLSCPGLVAGGEPGGATPDDAKLTLPDVTGLAGRDAVAPESTDGDGKQVARIAVEVDKSGKIKLGSEGTAKPWRGTNLPKDGGPAGGAGIGVAGDLPEAEESKEFIIKLTLTDGKLKIEAGGKAVADFKTLAKVMGESKPKPDVAEAKPLLEEWWMDIEIADAPAGKETLVTGPDERSVTADNLNVKVSLDGNPEESPKFTVKPDTVTADGPKDNQRACLVTPQFIFYTTPKAPYDIRYKVTIEEKTKTSGTSKNGLKLDTVVDGALNPWDMDPSKPGRQAKGTWQFGVDSTGKPPQATRRDATEVYE